MEEWRDLRIAVDNFKNAMVENFPLCKIARYLVNKIAECEKRSK